MPTKIQKTMRKYYCIVIIGDNSNTEVVLRTVINGKFNHLNLNKIFVSTFESDYSIWEIEQMLHKHKKSFFLTKMDGDNFTATIQDPKIQNDLFLDYVQKMIEHNNKNIDTSENIENQNFPPPDFFQYESEIFDIEEELNQIKNNVSKKKEKKKEVTLSLDELLDKINVVGYENLTENEKDTLKMYSQK